MACLNGIQHAVSIKPSTFLSNLESDLLKELNMVLDQKEELWALKSHVNWLIQGDQNMTFYHVSMLVRRKRNQIMAIKNVVGEWISEEHEVKDYVRNGFEDIYTTSFTCVN